MNRTMLFAVTTCLLFASSTAGAAVVPELEVHTEHVAHSRAPHALTVDLFGTSGPFDRVRLPGSVEVELHRLGSDEPAHQIAQLSIDSETTVPLALRIPRVRPGTYEWVVTAETTAGTVRASAPVEIRSQAVPHLRTDRTQYRPNDTVHWWATLVHAVDAHPMPGETVEIRMVDPEGVVIWSQSRELPESAMVYGQFELADRLRYGAYTCELRHGETVAKRIFEVRRVQLPRFFVDLAVQSTHRGLSARGDVRHASGGPIAVQVHWQANHAGRQVGSGVVDSDADGQFDIALPAATAIDEIEVSAIDGAGRRENAHWSAESLQTDSTLRVAVLPESDPLLCDVSQFVRIITSRSTDSLHPAHVKIVEGQTIVGEFDSPTGQLVVPIQIACPDLEETSVGSDTGAGSGAVRWTITATETAAQTEADSEDEAAASAVTETVELAWERIGQTTRALVRPRRVVLQGDASVDVDVYWPQPGDAVQVTYLRHSTALSTVHAEPVGANWYRTSLPIPPGVSGLATIRATSSTWSEGAFRRDGDIGIEAYGATATVFRLPDRLNIALSTASNHRPGEVATITAEVTDEFGQPSTSAHLAATIVDERARRISKPARPLLEVLQFDGQDHAEQAGLVFGDILRGGALDALALAALESIVAALPAETALPLRFTTAPQRIDRAREEAGPAYDALATGLASRGGRVTPDANGETSWEMAQILREQAWTNEQMQTPWGEDIAFDYLQRVIPERIAAELWILVTEQRLEAAAAHLYAEADAVRSFRWTAPYAALAQILPGSNEIASFDVDAWGEPIRLRAHDDDFDVLSIGPDAIAGTDDDLVFESVLAEGFPGLGMYGTGSGGGGASFSARHSRNVYTKVGEVRDNAPLRKRFDETVLWAVGVGVDNAGRAAFEAPLADSITTWIVELEGADSQGRVGHAESRIHATLDTFAELTVPDELAVGDEYTALLAVVRLSDTAESIQIESDATGCLDLLSGADSSFEFDGANTIPHYLRLRASCAGEGQIRVSLVDSAGVAIDRLQRSVRVESVGRLERVRRTIQPSSGRHELALVVPEDVVRASVRGTFRQLADPVDEALEGLESLLREPHGCFEQTTSTTFPNLLVLSLLQGKADRESERSRALSLVGQGYQRLLTYEVEGGGFSWFGESPANQVLTAYGLVEFVDMAAVYPVDSLLIERTRTWLLAQQQENGAWIPDASWLHDWSAVQGRVSTTAYIAWALTQTGFDGPPVKRALQYLRRNAKTLLASTYLTSLWAAAEASSRHGRVEAPLRALYKAAERTDGTWSLPTPETTMMYGQGTGASVESTSLAISALMRSGHQGDAKLAAGWLRENRSASGGWGTTQSTILALRALVELHRPQSPDHRATGSPGSSPTEVRLQGRRLGVIARPSEGGIPTLEFVPDQPAGPWTFSWSNGESEGTAAAGTIDLQLQWRRGVAESAESNGLQVVMQSPDSPIPLGGLGRVSITVQNPGPNVVAMPIVALPIPPGFSADIDSLDRLEQSHTVARYEDLGSVVYLYRSELRAGHPWQIELSIRADAEADVLQRSARAYAYYSPEVQGFSAAARLRSTPATK